MGRLGIAAELLDRVVKEAKVYGCGTIYITASSFWESRQIGIWLLKYKVHLRLMQ